MEKWDTCPKEEAISRLQSCVHRCTHTSSSPSCAAPGFRRPDPWAAGRFRVESGSGRRPSAGCSPACTAAYVPADEPPAQRRAPHPSRSFVPAVGAWSGPRRTQSVYSRTQWEPNCCQPPAGPRLQGRGCWLSVRQSHTPGQLLRVCTLCQRPCLRACRPLVAGMLQKRDMAILFSLPWRVVTAARVQVHCQAGPASRCARACPA